jgi:ElaB/YqjD/DUF883 family membrane-anchored ribosome-binding protein
MIWLKAFFVIVKLLPEESGSLRAARSTPGPFEAGHGTSVAAFGSRRIQMENIYSPEVEDQAKKTAREAQKLGKEVKKNFDDVVSRGKGAAEEFGFDAQGVAARARDYVESARKKVGKAAEHVTSYADDNTALVAVAAFGVGLLVGHLVTRES